MLVHHREWVLGQAEWREGLPLMTKSWWPLGAASLAECAVASHHRAGKSLSLQRRQGSLMS